MLGVFVDELPAVASGIGDFGTHALGVMRIEKGFRGWGSEMNCDVGPYEAGLDMFIRSDKVRLTPTFNAYLLDEL